MSNHIFTRDHGSFSSTRAPEWLPAAIEAAANDRDAPPFAVTIRTPAGIEAGASLLSLPERRGYAVVLISAEGARRTVMFQNEGVALAFFLEQGVAFARAVAEMVRTTGLAATVAAAGAAPPAQGRWAAGD
jgi:hypothetical protein